MLSQTEIQIEQEHILPWNQRPWRNTEKCRTHILTCFGFSSIIHQFFQTSSKLIYLCISSIALPPAFKPSHSLFLAWQSNICQLNQILVYKHFRNANTNKKIWHQVNREISGNNKEGACWPNHSKQSSQWNLIALQCVIKNYPPQYIAEMSSDTRTTRKQGYGADYPPRIQLYYRNNTNQISGINFLWKGKSNMHFPIW